MKSNSTIPLTISSSLNAIAIIVLQHAPRCRHCACRQSAEARRDGELQYRRPRTGVGRSRLGALLRGRTFGRGHPHKKLAKYNTAEKIQCIRKVRTGGSASYVELLSCLEIMRDVKEIREAEQLVPTEQPAALAADRRHREEVAPGTSIAGLIY